MWVAKIKLSSKGTLIGSKAQKHKINMFAFPLSYCYDRKWVIVHMAGVLSGKENDKVNFLNDLKKEKRVANFEVNNNFFIGTIKDPLYTKCIYNKDIIHLAPALISEHGFEIIEIGCFARNPLFKIAKMLEKNYEGKLVSIQKKKIKSISITRVSPELTDRQKSAIELAMKHGYYHSPRKIDLKRLAKLAGLSFSTYQVHLRKAEEKLIPYFYK